jgi:hypothetical protein
MGGGKGYTGSLDEPVADSEDMSEGRGNGGKKGGSRLR